MNLSSVRVSDDFVPVVTRDKVRFTRLLHHLHEYSMVHLLHPNGGANTSQRSDSATFYIQRSINQEAVNLVHEFEGLFGLPYYTKQVKVALAEAEGKAMILIELDTPDRLKLSVQLHEEEYSRRNPMGFPFHVSI